MEVQVDQIRIFYDVRGEGVPVVFLHGYPFDHTIWEPILPHLSDRARVILPDRRGFGQSEATHGVYTMRLMASDVVGLMDALGIEKAILVGHSMGGYISFEFARDYPARLLGLGLVATRATADSVEQRMQRYATAEEVARRGAVAVAEKMPAGLTRNPDLQRRLYDLITRQGADGIIGSLKGMAEREDYTPILPEIDVPAVIISGAEDQNLPRDSARQMQTALPRGRWVEIPGAGHLPMMEDPRATADALNGLIEEVSNLGVGDF